MHLIYISELKELKDMGFLFEIKQFYIAACVILRK